MIKKYCLYICCLFMFFGCKKDDNLVWNSQAGAYFYTEAFDYVFIKDSLTYSFAIRPQQWNEDTVKIPVKITGSPVANDRTVNIVANAGSTAVEGKHYRLLPCVIKANSFIDTAKILVMKQPELLTSEVSLSLKINNNSDFTDAVKENSKYLIKINNIITKPANWDNILVGFFGVYSKTKYRFIIDVTGIYEFNYLTPVGGVDFQFYLYIKQILKDALTNYNNSHGPLLDENNNPVTFPN
ncbi:DUF4843 domain-containing protein [Chitinophaga silvatica]|nr:DUF4843 domain-containing protein [Chitinophaga silvatica]